MKLGVGKPLIYNITRPSTQQRPLNKALCFGGDSRAQSHFIASYSFIPVLKWVALYIQLFPYMQNHPTSKNRMNCPLYPEGGQSI